MIHLYTYNVSYVRIINIKKLNINIKPISKVHYIFTILFFSLLYQHVSSFERITQLTHAVMSTLQPCLLLFLIVWNRQFNEELYKYVYIRIWSIIICHRFKTYMKMFVYICICVWGYARESIKVFSHPSILIILNALKQII